MWPKHDDGRYKNLGEMTRKERGQTLAPVREHFVLEALIIAAEKALYEMRHTIAPRDSFTDAVDALDAALALARGEK